MKMKKLTALLLALCLLLTLASFASAEETGKVYFLNFKPEADQAWQDLAKTYTELTGVEVGATTILSAILPECAQVHLVIDKAVAESEWFACTDGTPTCFVKILTSDLLGKYLPASGHILQTI